MAAHQLEDILTALGTHHQRATYSAVAALVGTTPRLLMRGMPRAPDNSWIVSKSTGKPTGYAQSDVHPQLTAVETVLTTANDLDTWLNSTAASGTPTPASRS